MQQPIGSGFGRDTSWKDLVGLRDLAGGLAIVTGGNAGLGKETALALALSGAKVLLTARSPEAIAATLEELGRAGAKNVRGAILDLLSPDSILQFANDVRDEYSKISVLVANAGVMASPLMRDSRGNEFQFSTNYLGHALLLSELAPLLAQSQGSRVVSLSSTGHHYSPVLFDDLNFERQPYDKWVAYGQSKTASSLLAVRVATALGREGVSGFAVHPGMIQTELGKYITPEDMEVAAKQMGELALQLPAFKTADAGAATTVWAALAPDLTGRTFAYCEDCDVARAIETPNYGWGVLPYATSEEDAERLWHEAAKLLGRPLPLL